MESNGVMPMFDQNLLSHANPEAMAAMMTGQAFVPDPSLGNIPMPDGAFLMPMMMQNGMPIEIPANTVSAGTTYAENFRAKTMYMG